MTLTVALHRPTRAIAQEFTSEGRQHGSVAFADEKGERVTLFTTPHVAREVALAFNAALPAEVEPEDVA